MKNATLLKDEMETQLLHEIKNPLALINANIDFLCITDEDATHLKSYEVIKKALKRINKIIDSFVKKDIECDEEIHICSLIREIINEYSIFSDNNEIVFEMACSKEDIAFKFNKIKAEILFYNIYKNAVEAIGEKGSVSAHIAENEKQIIIDVIDSGQGISEKIIDKIGQPFVTTKKKGSGLGLSICKSIISEYGGTFEIMNIDSGGCLARVIFPKNIL